MFQEKQQELQAAVLKVDQLTQQLEDLRKGKLNGFQSYNGQMTGPAAVELKKLYQELQVSEQKDAIWITTVDFKSFITALVSTNLVLLHLIKAVCWNALKCVRL